MLGRALQNACRSAGILEFLITINTFTPEALATHSRVWQDMRLYYFDTVEDSVVCNDEKLSAGSSASYVWSSKRFFNSTVFGEGAGWPTVVVAPSYLVDGDEAPNLAIEVSKAMAPEDTTRAFI